MRCCFGPYWKMGRALIGKESEDGLIGRSLTSILGRTGVRLAIGDNNQFWDHSKFPLPDLDVLLANVTSFNIRQTLTNNNTEVNAVITRIINMNGAAASDKIYGFFHGVQMAGSPNTSYTLPASSLTSNDTNKVSDGDHAEILYLNASANYDEEIVLDFSTPVPIRLRSIRFISDRNGIYALCTFQTQGTTVALNSTQSCGLTVVQIKRMINIFLSAATTYFKAPNGTTWIPGPNAYKSAGLVSSVYPGTTTNMYSHVDRELAEALSDLPPRCVVTFANPIEPLQQVPIIFYDGLFAVNNPDKYQVSVGLVDDYYIASVSAYPTLDLANEVTAPLETYTFTPAKAVNNNYSPIDVERAMKGNAWAMFDRSRDPTAHGLPLMRDEVDYQLMVWRAKNMSVVHSAGDDDEEDNAEVHSMVGSLLAGAASGMGSAASDAIKSKREQKYALERMRLAHGQNLEQLTASGKINLMTGLIMTKARATAQYQLDAARAGFDAASVSRNMNSHTYSPSVQNLRPPTYLTPAQGSGVRTQRQDWNATPRRESSASGNDDWTASSRRGSTASSIAVAENENVQWGGPPADAGWADSMEGVELPPREPVVGATARQSAA